jgi:MFS family permease
MSGHAASRDGTAARLELAAYGTGFFSVSSMVMLPMILSIWLDSVLHSLVLVGAVLAARQVAGLLYSIHGGVLLDRYGVRTPTLVLSLIAAVIPLLLPLSPSIPLLVALLMLSSLATKVGWMGSQMLVGGERVRGAVLAGRLVFVTSLARLVGTPLVGWAWDRGGSWGAFAVLAAWGFGGALAIWLAPPVARPSAAAPSGSTLRGVLLPNVREHAEAVKTLALPAVALFVLIGAVRQSVICMETSFYVMYLKRIGYSGSEIGWLIAVTAIAGAAAALFTARLLDRVSPVHVFVAASILGFASLAVTPLAPQLPLLVAGAAGRGIAISVTQSVAVTVLATSVPPPLRGRVGGIGQVAISAAWLALPPVMGWIAEIGGLENSFYIVPGLYVVALLAAVVPARSFRRIGVGDAA